MKISLRSLEREQSEKVLAFSRLMFGPDAYQGSSDYLSWLYEDRPASRGWQDCLVAYSGEAVVGLVHRMLLPCCTEAGLVTLASLQNHVVAPELRGGAGIMLLQRAVQDQPLAFSPGVHGRLGDAYRRLGYREIPSYWLSKVLRPIAAVHQVASARLGRGRISPSSLLVSETSLRRSKINIMATTSPSNDALARLAAEMQRQGEESGVAFVCWTSEMVRWRYFSKPGPAHVLVGDPGNSSWAVLSYGLRNGVRVARLVEYEERGDKSFMRDVLRVARWLGAAVALAYSTRQTFRDALLSTGWRFVKNAPSSFAKGACRLSLSAASCDTGFEAIETKIVP